MILKKQKELKLLNELTKLSHIDDPDAMLFELEADYPEHASLIALIAEMLDDQEVLSTTVRAVTKRKSELEIEISRKTELLKLLESAASSELSRLLNEYTWTDITGDENTVILYSESCEQKQFLVKLGDDGYGLG